MIVFRYDKTFEGLLTAIFDAYNRNTFPVRLLSSDEIEPLFVDACHTVITDPDRAGRVWKGLEKRMMLVTRNMLSYVWLSEINGSVKHP